LIGGRGVVAFASRGWLVDTGKMPVALAGIAVGVLSLVCLLTWACPAAAGQVLDRVRAQGVVRCGSVERPGLASAGDGADKGLNVDVCRAIATAVLGSPDRIAFLRYETPKQYDAIRNGEDDISFLTASEIYDHQLVGKVLPGPTVFVESHRVMVPVSSKARHVQDLAGQSICFLSPSAVDHTVENYFDRLHKPFVAVPYSEDGEMVDAYLVQRCHAIAYEITTLATVSADRGINRLKSRILPEPFTVFPIMATTGLGDGEWSAIVAWTVHTLISAERPETKWSHGGAKALPLDGPALGLDKEWQNRVIGAVGHYGEIFERNLGRQSPLKLTRGLNANQVRGGLMLSPFLE
jgi:general L-amino acid transport system substrate-binding protein